MFEKNCQLNSQSINNSYEILEIIKMEFFSIVVVVLKDLGTFADRINSWRKSERNSQ